MNKYLLNKLENVKALTTIQDNAQYDVFSNLEITEIKLDVALEIINQQAVIIASWINHNELNSIESAALISNSIDLLTLDVYSILRKKL